MSPQRCACGHYQLPTHRDAVVARPGGQSDQHGRLNCERITLGAADAVVVYNRRGWAGQLGSVPRAISFARLD